MILIAWAAGCGDDQNGGPGDSGSVDAAIGGELDAAPADAGSPDAASPAALRVTGSAEGMAPAGTDRVECSFALDFIDLADDGAGGFSGVATGEVFRRTFDGAALRFEFSALVGGPATLSADRRIVELRLVGDQPPEAVPFWLALEVIGGAETAPFEYEGEWVCATVLVGDPMDSPIEAAGTWVAVPLGAAI